MAKKPKELCEGCGEWAQCETRQVTCLLPTPVTGNRGSASRGYTIAFYCRRCIEIADDPFLMDRIGGGTEFGAVQVAARR